MSGRPLWVTQVEEPAGEDGNKSQASEHKDQGKAIRAWGLQAYIPLQAGIKSLTSAIWTQICRLICSLHMLSYVITAHHFACF